MKITDEMLKEVYIEIIRDWLKIQSMPEECRQELLEAHEEKLRAYYTMAYRREVERDTK